MQKFEIFFIKIDAKVCMLKTAPKTLYPARHLPNCGVMSLPSVHHSAHHIEAECQT